MIVRTKTKARLPMFRALTNVVMLRFYGGFALGVVLVLSGASDFFHAIA